VRWISCSLSEAQCVIVYFGVAAPRKPQREVVGRSVVMKEGSREDARMVVVGRAVNCSIPPSAG